MPCANLTAVMRGGNQEWAQHRGLRANTHTRARTYARTQTHRLLDQRVSRHWQLGGVRVGHRSTSLTRCALRKAEYSGMAGVATAHYDEETVFS